MAEEKRLFSMDYERFNEILSRKSWFNLQEEFHTRPIPFSQSFLLWVEESRKKWFLVDFETNKTYNIEQKTGAEESSIVEIWELSNQEEQLTDLNVPETILSRLQQGPLGTNKGFIDLLTKIDLGKVNLEGLKRSDLFGAGLSFESAYQDLLNIHKMFEEILISFRESLVDLSRDDLQQFVDPLNQFFEHVEHVENFDVKDENPAQRHINLLGTISQFCENAKRSLREPITYLRSKKVEQFEDQVKTVLTDAEEKFNTETEKLQKLGEEAQQQTGEIVQKLEQTHLKYQNQLTEKPISQYKEIFASQAENHRKSAQFWMWMAIVATGAFGGVFVLLSVLLGSGGTQLTGIFQNLFTKGFILSPIYVWLNRSIKNHTAQKHLEVINVHRQNALETFDTFVAAAEGNRETRDAVLLAATKAIFDANQSGYLSAKTSGSDGASPVQQIIKEVIPSKSSDKSD